MIMPKAHKIAFVVVLLSIGGTTFAFNGHIVIEGPLELTIGDIADVTEFDKPQPVQVTLKNAGTSSLKVGLKMTHLVDEWYSVGQAETNVPVAPGEQAGATFRIAAREGACSALYPVHVYARFQHQGRDLTAHAVQILQSNFERVTRASDEPVDLPANVVPANGTLPLWTLQTHRAAWRYYDKPLVYMPVGWTGSSVESSANFSTGQVTRDTTKHAIIMHPPWKPGGGTIFAEYRLKLPDVTPIELHFANAIRDHTAEEPPSDGVTFRVWVDKHKLFEHYTDSKRWVDEQVDLSKFAGRKILLQLESHPGPKRNTTCDSSYWGEPTVVSGTPPVPHSEAQRERLRERARNMVASQEKRGDDAFAFTLDGDYTAAIILGKAGLADSAIAFGRGKRCVVFDGLGMSVLGHNLAASYSPVVVRKIVTEKDRLRGKVVVKHRLVIGDDHFDLTANICKDKGGLRISLECPKRITDMSLANADQKASRVYYGHGYCIVEPEAFRAGFGGHNLSTSHVGFDFDKGISLLIACDHPPDYLEVNPSQRMYSLHTHLDATMTFVPSTEGAFDCARKYRPLYDKEAAPGFRRKAGRFVFDIWGGRYADIAETMKRMVNYGLTDSLLTVHVWQRWGYDYRLPDIYPPQPQLGTIEDMRQIAEVCAEHDIPWGLHDNYIDFYPDAKDYSYDHICFTEQGEPVKAWINRGRQAQSYRWRPDHIMPFVKRNLKLIKPNLKPTHYFIDVFTSLPCFDYYDKQGDFHSMLETRKCWGEAFAWIRDYLGANAPMTSEAGHDQLIGYLDGSDCQHLRLTPDGGRFCIRIPCRDWERVPWYDAVLHDKFSLHGVGYSGRYQGGRSRREHGIESDDYISAEILEGHALMIDRGGFGRGAVRKYWLAQDFIRSIALDRIEDIQFVDGDIHRQVIRWQSGAEVHVNRGDKDWSVAGKILPQYGYFAKNGPLESTIERIDGTIVEQSRGPSSLYVNARGYSPDGTLAIQPIADKVAYLGGRRFKLMVNWNAGHPAPKDLQVFIHFNSEKSDRRDKIAFQSGGQPAPGTSKWEGDIVTGENWVVEIPKNLGAGQYSILAGLWDPSNGKRYPLLGQDDGSLGYHVGKLMVEGTASRVTHIRLVKDKPKPRPAPRWNVEQMPVDFGPIMTPGAVRCDLKKNMIIVTPLPDAAAFTIAIDVGKLTSAGEAKVRSIVAVDENGREIRTVGFVTNGDVVELHTRKNEFAYHVFLNSLSALTE